MALKRSAALIIEPTPKDERDLIERRDGSVMRSVLQIERDREYEARAYLSGISFREMAEHLGVTPSTIERDIAAIRDEWMAARIRNFDLHVNIELAKLDALEQTYWQAWRDSQKPIRKVYREVKDEPRVGRGRVAVQKYDEDGEEIEAIHLIKPAPLRSKRVVSEQPTTGNFYALAGIERVIAQRRKLLGLDAPTKIAPTSPDGKTPYDPVSNATRATLILGEFLRKRDAGDAPKSLGGGDHSIDGIATERGTDDH